MTRPRQFPLQVLRELLAENPGIGGGDLARRLQASQPTVSRSLAALGDEVARLGRGRGARYALRRPVGRHGTRWPLYRIDAEGRAQTLGDLSSLHGGAWWFNSQAPRPAWMAEAFAQGLYPDLPWFLDELRPQGFLGRSFVASHARELDAPEDLAVWSSDHVLAALLRYGDNLPGDLVLGEQALERALRESLDPPDAVDAGDRPAEFLRRAQAALQGRPVGSSAGGEQPKFTALLRDAPGRYRATVVKFSEPAESSPAAARWCDLLRCEHHAARALQAHGLAAAPTELVSAQGRCFLQSTRFDRSPTLGRRGFVTLRALDAAYFGRGRAPWTEMADLMLSQRWIGADAAASMRSLGLFGEMIANTDMHFGNVAFELVDAAPFALVPAYDMLPMLYAPGPGGALVEREFTPPVPLPRYQREWAGAARAASRFWRAVQDDAAISEGFRRVAQANGAALHRLQARFA
jgi:serine/threonine protein kinase HipA of HipAB toxin-antitoxin module